MLQPAQQAVNAVLAGLGCPVLPCPILEAMTELPDLYLHPGIESFKYPDSNSKVQYIGALPSPTGQSKLPEWWQHIDRTKHLVLATQGIRRWRRRAKLEAIHIETGETFNRSDNERAQ